MLISICFYYTPLKKELQDFNHLKIDEIITTKKVTTNEAALYGRNDLLQPNFDHISEGRSTG
jgi:hypothetical protein